jgi:ribonuclease HII
MLDFSKHCMDYPNFKLEMALWQRGLKCVAGADEVGRGSFAGPIVAAVVSFSPDIKLEVDIQDSKKLKPKQREKANVWIREKAATFGIGEVSVSTINRLGMAKASQMVFRKAVIDANHRLQKNNIDFLLIDAFYIPYVRGLARNNQKAIVKGDSQSVSIAAASIIAKVYRDKGMRSLGRKTKYKVYGWGRNKGYGTRWHQKAIRTHGPTKLHRKQFIQTFLARQI